MYGIHDINNKFIYQLAEKIENAIGVKLTTL